MKALITGIDGFVGNYLTANLLNDGYEVYGTSIIPNYKKENVKIFNMDLLDKNRVLEIISKVKPDKIFHLAGQSAVGLSWKNPTLTFDVNVNGTINLLEVLRVKNINTKILIIGSSDQYGIIKEEDCPINENQEQNPQSPYGISKKTQEEIALLYSKVYNMNIIVARPFNHIGPGQNKNFVVPDFASKIIDIERGAVPIIKVGNLDTYRDFTDVRDIVRAYVLLLEKGNIGEIYNIGSGKAIRVQEILDKLINLSRLPISVEIDPDKFRPIDVPLVLCDNSKINSDTGWEPQISIDKTLIETLEYWRNKS